MVKSKSKADIERAETELRKSREELEKTQAAPADSKDAKTAAAVEELRG